MLRSARYFHTWLAVLLRITDKSHALSHWNRRPERTVVLLYNKPPNVVTTHAGHDEKGRINVFDDIRSMRGYIGAKNELLSLEEATGVHQSAWNAGGRLDADTTGLLLITNDGGLVHHVTNKNAKTNTSASPLGKTYQAQIMGYHEDNSPVIQQLRLNGVDIGAKYGGQTQPVPDIAVLMHPTSKTTLVSLTLFEGKNRQIRRMFHALGSGVMKLTRTAIGEKISLAGLEESQWRILSDDEVRSALFWEPRLLESRSHRKGNGQDPGRGARDGNERKRKRSK